MMGILDDLTKIDEVVTKASKDRHEFSYEDPITLEVVIGDQRLKAIEQIKSITILKKGGTACTFQMELHDRTFKLEPILLKFIVPVTITYGNRKGKASYSGNITGVALNPVLHQGVEITVSGYLVGSSSKAISESVVYDAKTYGGSVTKILNAHLGKRGMGLSIDPAITDQQVVDTNLAPMDVTAEAGQSTIDFVGRLVKYLDADFVIVSADKSKKGSKDTVVVTRKESAYSVTTNGKTSTNSLKSKVKRSRLTIEVNHQDSVVAEYKLDIKKTKVTQMGKKNVSTVNSNTNQVKKDSIVPSYQDAVGGLLSVGGVDVSKVAVGGTTNTTELKEVATAQESIEAVYNLSIDLFEGYPSLMPHVSEIHFIAHITAEECELDNRTHHSTGIYIIKEITDTITATSIKSSMVAYRTPGMN